MGTASGMRAAMMGAACISETRQYGAISEKAIIFIP
jgi:hypothetical protein